MVQRGLRDLEFVKRYMESAKGCIEAKEVKDSLAPQGYTFVMSLYGALRDKETGRVTPRRIEILSQKMLNENDINLIYRWFQNMPPEKSYTIWIYNREGNLMKEVFNTW